MFSFLISLLICSTSVAANSCAIAGERSRNCYDDCEGYCSKHEWCELDRTSRSSNPFKGNYCGWVWQAKCICKTCPGGFCGKVKKMLDQAMPIARKHVQIRLDQLTYNSNYERYPCATENGVCSCNGEVRYGANGRFSGWRTVSESIDCNNDVFGDPIRGVKKACYCRPRCASEHGVCACHGEVQYGANGRFSEWRAVSGSVNCGNSVFGDPIPGVVKACYCKPRCAAEREKCWCHGDVRYGANGRYSQWRAVHGGQIDCNNDVFGDPNFGVGKACYCRQSGMINDEWRKYFGNRNNHIRKPFMLNVLQNMKRYLADIGYEDSNMVRLIARPQGQGKARMACSSIAPCYGTIEKTWPQKIGFWVNTNDPRILSHTSVDKIAALMIHELSHSTVVASRKSLQVTGDDIPLTKKNVGTLDGAPFLATRDWSYDHDDVKNYAKCYERGQNCPGAGDRHSFNRPAANMKMDVPLNNAANYEHWILLADEVPNCVSGDMLVESESSGPIPAGALLEGMKIRGRDAKGNSGWCTVQDIYFNGMGTLFGNFTEGHLVLDDSSGMVLPSGNSSHEHFGARYTIFTDCPVMENKDGELFTPLAQTFCGARDFTWSEYLVLWTAIQQVVRDTGIFWFHLDETFTNCKNQTLCGNVTDWRDALPPVCESLMSCASTKNDVVCDDFEEVAQNFFDRHIRAERVEEIKNAYANYGSISQSVKESSENENHLWMWIAIVAGGLAVMLAILLVTWRCCCQKNQDEVKQVVAAI